MEKRGARARIKAHSLEASVVDAGVLITRIDPSAKHHMLVRKAYHLRQTGATS